MTHSGHRGTAGQQAADGPQPAHATAVCVNLQAWESKRACRLIRLKFLECFSEQQSGQPVTPSLSQESFERRQVIRRNQHQVAIGRLDNAADILQFGLARLRGDTARWFSAAILEIVNETDRLKFQQPAGPAPAAAAAEVPNPDPPAEIPKPSSEDSKADEPPQRAFARLKRAHTCIDLTLQ